MFEMIADLEQLKKRQKVVEAEAKTKIDRARWWGFNHVPWYAALASNLSDVIEWDPNNTTAMTDGRSIFWNPLFVQRLSDREMRFVLFHETLHCAHMHFWRLPRNRRANKAGDYEINAILRRIDGMQMPQVGLYNPQYENMSCEDIYRQLPKQEEGNEGDGNSGKGEGDIDPGGCGGFKDPARDGQNGKQKGEGKAPGRNEAQTGSGSDSNPDSEPISTESLKERWERALVQAEIAAKVLKQGNIPGHFERILRRIRVADLDWRQETAEFIRMAIGVRNDWTRPSKRHATQSVIYPRKKSDGLGTVIFIRDTSGSISDDESSEQASHIDACIAENNCEGIVLDNDTHIRKEYRISPSDPAPLTAVGGGGTDFRYIPGYVKNLIENGDKISGVIIFSDGAGAEFTDAEWPSDVPLLWIIKNAWSAYGYDGNKVMLTGRTVNITH